MHLCKPYCRGSRCLLHLLSGLLPSLLRQSHDLCLMRHLKCVSKDSQGERIGETKSVHLAFKK